MVRKAEAIHRKAEAIRHKVEAIHRRAEAIHRKAEVTRRGDLWRFARTRTRAAARRRAAASTLGPLAAVSRTTFAPSPRPAGVLPPGRAIYPRSRPSPSVAGPRVSIARGPLRRRAAARVRVLASSADHRRSPRRVASALRRIASALRWIASALRWVTSALRWVTSALRWIASALRWIALGRILRWHRRGAH